MFLNFTIFLEVNIKYLQCLTYMNIIIMFRQLITSQKLFYKFAKAHVKCM